MKLFYFNKSHAHTHIHKNRFYDITCWFFVCASKWLTRQNFLFSTSLNHNQILKFTNEKRLSLISLANWKKKSCTYVQIYWDIRIEKAKQKTKSFAELILTSMLKWWWLFFFSRYEANSSICRCYKTAQWHENKKWSWNGSIKRGAET